MSQMKAFRTSHKAMRLVIIMPLPCKNSRTLGNITISKNAQLVLKEPWSYLNKFWLYTGEKLKSWEKRQKRAQRLQRI